MHKIGIVVLILACIVGTFFFSTANTDATAGTLEQKIESLETQVLRLEETVEALQSQMVANYIGDCYNENMLRQLYGIPPVSLEECVSWRFQQPQDEENTSNQL